MRPRDFVISEMSWLVSGGLGCRMPVETGCLCAFPPPNGELWSGRSKPSIPSQPAGPRWRSGSATWWWRTPERSSAWKSPAQRYVTLRAGFRTGSVGVSPALCVVPPPVAAKNADAQKPRCQQSQAEEGSPPLLCRQRNIKKTRTRAGSQRGHHVQALSDDFKINNKRSIRA